MSSELKSMKDELNGVCPGLIVRVEDDYVKVSDGGYLNLMVEPAPGMKWQVYRDLYDGHEFESEYRSSSGVAQFFRTEVC